ncbi:MAG: YjdF family protein [Candidatus Algichlamydia australiensis]|nr:YjdF family protein [Chlamydiales bacterium]
MLSYEKSFWVGTFERTDKEGYAVARHIFGAEPTDPEIYEFVLKHYQELNFEAPKKFTLQIKGMNSKKVQKEVHREVKNSKK